MCDNGTCKRTHKQTYAYTCMHVYSVKAHTQTYAYTCMHVYSVCTVCTIISLFRAVKLTSPFLNVVIDIGVIILLVNVIFLGLDGGITTVSIGAFCMVSATADLGCNTYRTPVIPTITV